MWCNYCRERSAVFLPFVWHRNTTDCHRRGHKHASQWWNAWPNVCPWTFCWWFCTNMKSSYRRCSGSLWDEKYISVFSLFLFVCLVCFVVYQRNGITFALFFEFLFSTAASRCFSCTFCLSVWENKNLTRTDWYRYHNEKYIYSLLLRLIEFYCCCCCCAIWLLCNFIASNYNSLGNETKKSFFFLFVIGCCVTGISFQDIFIYFISFCLNCSQSKLKRKRVRTLLCKNELNSLINNKCVATIWVLINYSLVMCSTNDFTITAKLHTHTITELAKKPIVCTQLTGAIEHLCRFLPY